MGLLSPSVSIMRYKVVGKIEEPILETIAAGLNRYSFPDPADESVDKAAGWTSFENPFRPDFQGSSFLIGSYFVFSLRVDKKSIPPKLVNKYCSAEVTKRLEETGQDFLSQKAKKDIRDHVMNVLTMRLPAIPSIYDLIWSYEEASLWFFTTQSSSNEELETLFNKSFKLSLVRLFPYTTAHFLGNLSESELDIVSKLTPTNFSE